jgi:sugar lactone lactonase YvrE
VKKNFIPPAEIIPPSERHHESIPEYCRGLAVDEASNVYVACVGNRCVLKVTPDGESTVLMRCQKPWTATAVAVRNGDLYVLEYDDETPTEGRNWPPRIRKRNAEGEVSAVVTITRD